MEKIAIREQQLIFNFRKYVSETDAVKLKNGFESLLKESNFEILGFNEHHFQPQGYTAVWILAESHLAIHTFPENQTTYLELSSCSQSKNQTFQELLQIKINNGEI